MKPRNTAVNVITAILASLLSIILVVVLLTAMLYTSVTALVQPTNIVTMVQNVDYLQLFLDSESVQDNSEELEMQAEIVKNLVSTDAMKEVIGLYAADVSDLLTEGAAKGRLTADAFQQIVHDHIDSIAQIAHSMAPEDMTLEEVKQQILEGVDEEAEAIIALLPTVDDVKAILVDSGAEQLIHAILSPAIIIAFVVICVILAGAIYACRFRNFGGFLWLGIDAAIAGVLLSGVTLLVNSGLIQGLLESMASEMLPLAHSLLSVYVSGLVIRLVILFGLAVVFIVGYILLQIYVVKKKQASPAVRMAFIARSASAAPTASTMPRPIL